MITLQRIAFIIMGVAVVYSFSAGVITGMRSFQTCRWMRRHFPEAWGQLPWGWRLKTIGARDVALKQFLQAHPGSDYEIKGIYKGVRRAGMHSWVSLMLALSSLLLGIMLTHKHCPWMTVSDVIHLANQAAQSAGYRLADFEDPEARWEFVERDHTWYASYEEKEKVGDLAIPGNYFLSVRVDDKTGKATVMIHGM
jgi:hypothetical protein